MEHHATRAPEVPLLTFSAKLGVVTVPDASKNSSAKLES